MKKQTILFLDNTYPQAYQLSTLQQQAIGGTEASVVRTALILSSSFNVIVAQKFRQKITHENETLVFIPKNEMQLYKPDFVVVLRKFPLLKQLVLMFPNAKLFLWLHTYKGYEYVFKRQGLSQTHTTIICNSDFHRKDVNRLLNKTVLAKFYSMFTKNIKVNYCYNPIFKPIDKNSKRDLNKLLFFSSPNKGLKQVIESFNFINTKLPKLKLYIANPGYKTDLSIQHNENIIYLGSLPYKEMMKHVKQSLCVFYVQDSFSETFGLIYAEANALGTPVLAHDLGSAREILDQNNPIIDVNNYQEIIETITSWQKDFPKVTYNENFSEKNILKQWGKLLV